MKNTSHRSAILLMILVTTLWSIAGVFTRHLEAARGFEVSFWRSLFAALFVAGALLWQNQGKPQNARSGGAFAALFHSGRFGLLSGLMWSVMFSCFMIALTLTTVANTLIVMSISPLLTALFAWAFLRQRINPRTWLAIICAFGGIVWMFAKGLAHTSQSQLLGMAIALAVPLASSVNVITIKKAGNTIDLIPAIFLGGVISALAMLVPAWPLQASWHDIGILAILGFFQLGLPCMLLLKASEFLTAPEISLLALLEVLLGPLWAWLGAGEVPLPDTLIGGSVVLGALLFNELVAMRSGPLVPPSAGGRSII